MLYHLILASALSCNVLAGPLIKRDSPFATCTFDNSTVGKPIGEDPTCDTGCNEDGCDAETDGLVFANGFIGATYPNSTLTCNAGDDCDAHGRKVAALPYGTTGVIHTAAGNPYFGANTYVFGCQVKVKGDAKARIATLDALFPQLKNAGSAVRAALAKVTSLPVQCESTATPSQACNAETPQVCEYLPGSVTEVGGVALPKGTVIKPVDGIGLPAQGLGTCNFDGDYECVQTLEVNITKVPKQLEKHGLCAEQLSLLIDDFQWNSL